MGDKINITTKRDQELEAIARYFPAERNNARGRLEFLIEVFDDKKAYPNNPLRKLSDIRGNIAKKMFLQQDLQPTGSMDGVEFIDSEDVLEPEEYLKLIHERLDEFRKMLSHLSEEHCQMLLFGIFHYPQSERTNALIRSMKMRTVLSMKQQMIERITTGVTTPYYEQPNDARDVTYSW